jgi:hypothetical protein
MLFSFCFNELREIQRAPQGWYEEWLRPWKPVPTVDKTVGKVVHFLLAQQPSCSQDVRYAYRRLAKRSKSACIEVDSRVKKLMQVAERLQAADPAAIITREPEVKWTDPLTRWTLFAIPDACWIDPVPGGVLHIVDYKTSSSFSRSHQDQLEFFALVLSRAFPHCGRIMLHCRLLGSGIERKWESNPASMKPLFSSAQQAVVRFDLLLAAAFVHIKELVPRAASPLKRAVATTSLPLAIAKWFDVTAQCKVDWRKVHAHSVRAWWDVRHLPVRIAYQLGLKTGNRFNPDLQLPSFW